jgi:hypothetical protein
MENELPGVALNHDPSDRSLTRVIGVSHRHPLRSCSFKWRRATGTQHMGLPPRGQSWGMCPHPSSHPLIVLRDSGNSESSPAQAPLDSSLSVVVRLLLQWVSLNMSPWSVSHKYRHWSVNSHLPSLQSELL